MATQVVRRRFTVAEYDRMAASGILTEDDCVELLDGEIDVMTPIGGRHAACVNRLNRLLGRQVGEAALVSVQHPVRLSTLSEPGPDIALLRPRADDYAQDHPSASDVLLLIEVADTSLDTDRAVKLPLYAQALAPEVWLVDLVADQIHRYTEPHGVGIAGSAVPDGEQA